MPSFTPFRITSEFTKLGYSKADIDVALRHNEVSANDKAMTKGGGFYFPDIWPIPNVE